MMITGLIAMVLAAAVAAAVATGLSWRLPMAPLSPAVVAAGTVAGLALLIAGGGNLVIIVLVAGLIAAGLGALHDRAMLSGWQLSLTEGVLGAGAAMLTAIYAPWPLAEDGLLGVAAVGVGAVLIACSIGLRHADRLPGYAGSLTACAAAVSTFLAIWLDVADYLSIWWVAALAVVLIGLAVVSRARATPFGAAGTSFLTVQLGLLLYMMLVQSS